MKEKTLSGTMPIEQWYPIPGIEPLHEVSSHGRVRRTWSKEIRKLSYRTPGGCSYVNIRDRAYNVRKLLCSAQKQYKSGEPVCVIPESPPISQIQLNALAAEVGALLEKFSVEEREEIIPCL